MASNPPPPSGANGPYNALPTNVPGGGGGMMPPAGHFADMQTLMQNLDLLSGWLQQNREDFEGVREGLRKVEGIGGRSTSAGQPQNLENGVESSSQEQSHTISQLQNHLVEAHQRINSLEATIVSLQGLHTLFNNTLTETMRLIRNYTYNQSIYTADLHRHYTKLLQDARKETLEAQLIHQKWQEGLAKVSETCRDAVKAREKEADEGGWRAEVKGLRLENRLLRKKVGWKIRPESDDEVEEEPGEEEEGGNGRGSRGSLGLRNIGEAVIV